MALVSKDLDAVMEPRQQHMRLALALSASYRFFTCKCFPNCDAQPGRLDDPQISQASKVPSI
jgi:hypothetical protein